MSDPTPRIPLLEPLETRDQTLAYDRRMVNGIAEKSTAGTLRLIKRPGNRLAFNGPVGTGQGITNYQNSLYSISGDSLAYFNTTSGLTATQVTNAAPWSVRAGVAPAYFLGKLWMFGGANGVNYYNDVWSSVDGVNWTQVTAAAPWGVRQGASSIVFNGKLYLMGGNNSTTALGDVWSTPDGVTWTQTSANAWPGRQRFGLTAFNNLMWVSGGAGRSGANVYSDVYYSSDGVSWTQTTASAPWVGRANHAFFAANNLLWVVGGLLTGAFANATTDSWSSPDGITWTRVSSNPFGVAASGVWPVAAIPSRGEGLPLPPPVTVNNAGTGGTGATAWAFTDFDDDGDDDDFQGGGLVQVSFNAVGSGYTSAPALTFGTTVGVELSAYAFLDGTSNGGAKYLRASTFNGVTYILEYSDGGTFVHTVWMTTDGVTYTNLNVSFASGWTPRDTDFLAAGNLWIFGGFASSYRNDVWAILLNGQSFPLSPNVANQFYHFNQTSLTVASPLLVFKSTKDLYSFNRAVNNLVKLSNSANYPATTVPGLVSLSSYFFVMDPQGRIWNSAINDASTWTALGFVTMQNEPSGGVAIAKLLNYVVGFGQWTTEFFYVDPNNAPPASPLSPNQALAVQVGCAAGESFVEMQNSIVWVGQTRREGQGVYMFQNGFNPVRISTPFVDRILQNDPLTSVSAYNLDLFGHSHYVLTLNTSNITLVYSFDAGIWSTFTSTTPQASNTVNSLASDPYGLVTAVCPNHGYNDGDPVNITGAANPLYNGQYNIGFVDINTFTYVLSANPGTNAGTAQSFGYSEGKFTPVASTQVYDVDYVQDPSTGAIYSQDITDYTDHGNPVNLLCITERWDGDTTAWKFLRRATVVADLEASSILIRYSDTDYQSWSNYRVTALNVGQRATFSPGGRFRRRAFSIRHTAATPFRGEALEMEIILGDF